MNKDAVYIVEWAEMIKYEPIIIPIDNRFKDSDIQPAGNTVHFESNRQWDEDSGLIVHW